MSESPPQGSLLSNFLSGGNSGRKTPAPSPRKRAEGDIPMVYNPALKKWVPLQDQAAQLGLQVASHPINYVEGALGGLISELAGRDVIKRSGGEEDILKMNHDYLTKAANEVGDKDSLRLLQIEKFEDYDKDYRSWVQAKQNWENKEKLSTKKGWLGEEPTEQGFGKFVIKRDRFSGSSQGFRKAMLASAVGPIINDLNLGEHAEVPYLNKVEQSKYLPNYLEEKHFQRKRYLEGQLRSVERDIVSIVGVPESDPAMAALREKLRTLRSDITNLETRLSQHEKDKELRQKNSPDKVTGTIAKTQDRVKEKLLEKGKVQKATSAAGQIYSAIKKIDQDPFGFLVDQTVGKPLKFIWGRIWGRPQLFGRGTRFGLNLGSKLKDWLLKRSWGKVALFGTNLLGDAYKKGLNGLIKLGSRILGRAFGFAISGISRAIFAGIGVAIGAIATPIVLTVLGVFGAIAVFVLIFFMIIAPLFVGLNPPVAAATPSDLAIVISAGKTKDVSANETVSFTIRATSYIDRVTNIVITSTPDGNFATVNPQDGGVASGIVITWPGFNLALGESRNLTFTATTNGSVTAETSMQVQVVATSNEGFRPTAIIFINRAGGPVGADGRHSYPVLGNNSWTCWHSPPNFNAIDIFANPGTPVVAAISGRAEASENSLGGPVVFLYGDDGFSYYYAHLEVGGRASGKVGLGEVIGYISGDTLRSRNNGSPHVHFSIDTRGIHDGPDTPAGPFLDAVGGTNNCR